MSAFSMRMGMGLGAMQVMASASEPPASVWTISAAADGLTYFTIQCATTGQTLTAAGGAEIKLSIDGEWGTSVEIPAGETDRDVYFRGNGIGGTLTFPSSELVTYLDIFSPGTSITGSINGMALKTLSLTQSSTYITGDITGMPLTSIYLYSNCQGITGSVEGMELTYLYLRATNTALTGDISGMPLTTLYLRDTVGPITGDISGMTLTTLYLRGTLERVYGVVAQLGTPLSSMNILGGTTFNYDWTLQDFGGTKHTWTATTMSIDCRSTVGAVEFNTWLKGLASVSNPGDATLTLRNTPTVDDLNDAGCGETNETSGYYAMVTTLGYNLSLGT